MTRQLDGKAIAATIKEELKAQVSTRRRKITLAVIQVGNDPASSIYVKNKQRACEYIGIHSLVMSWPASITEAELLEHIHTLNQRDDIDGILVQLPLPPTIDAQAVIRAIHPDKDVDGFHPQNVGALSMDDSGFLPCTPAGIVELLKRSQVDIAGKECVIIGRSNIVGKPVATLMLREHATVTLCHSRTQNLPQICQRADILIVAIGKPRAIDRHYIKPGAVVIDVGIHRDNTGLICGDVDFADVQAITSAITPVPGGVGPMTIAMLMHNCLIAANRRVLRPDGGATN